MQQIVGAVSPQWTEADELRHADVAVEAWWWWGSCEPDEGPDRADRADRDGLTGVFVGLELRGNRFDYWAGLVREGEPYLYVEELDGTGLRQGLELKPPEMWAGHECDLPFGQWSLGNEAHGVLLADPTEAWRRARGQPVPVTFDIEWYAGDDPTPITADPPVSGYRQHGEIDARIELLEGVLAIEGPAERVHVWGVPYLPASFAMPTDDRGLRAPYRRSDGVNVDQVLTSTRWWVSA